MGSHDEITGTIIGAAMRVHSALGPGLLETAYEECLAFELADLGLQVLRQHPIPVTYKSVRLERGYRIDLLVEHAVIVEVKSVQRLMPVHDAQLISYLRLARCPVGLILNFNVPHLREGIRRKVNRSAETPK